jgi:hypothetical protein
VGILFTGPLSFGYSGNNDYFKDCEVPSNIPTDYVEVYDATGAVKEQDRTYTFKIIDKNTLRIVLVDDVYFAEGDKIVVKTTVTNTSEAGVVEDVVFNLTGGVWVREGEAPAAPVVPDEPVAEGPFKAVSAATEDNEYAVGVLFTGPLSVGYSGNNDYFKDCEDPANIPTDFVEVYDASGAVKEQDRTYTFKIIDKNTLRIVLVDDVYFAEGDRVVLKTSITDASGGTAAAEAAFMEAHRSNGCRHKQGFYPQHCQTGQNRVLQELYKHHKRNVYQGKAQLFCMKQVYLHRQLLKLV